MKKILVLVPDMKLGGVSTSVINFCNELSSRKHNVYFLNMGKKNEYLENKINSSIKRIRLEGLAKYWQLGIRDFREMSLFDKIKIIPLAIIKKLTNHSKLWMNIVFYKYSIKDTFDVVVAFRQCSPCYYFALNCINAKKRIAFIHGDINYMGDISSWDIYFNEFDKVACVSNAVREGFKQKYADLDNKFVTVYNMFNSKEIREMANEKINSSYFDKNQCNIVTVARIENSTKRIDIIPSICDILKKQGLNNFHWYVIGDGPDFEANRLLSNKLHVDDVLTFCGSMDNPYTMMRNSDFSVLPSKTEAFGMVVLESLILGVPVVAAMYDSVYEVLEEGVTGLIADQSIQDLAKKIASLIKDKNKLELLKFEISRKKITNDKAYDQFMDCICD